MGSYGDSVAAFFSLRLKGGWRLIVVGERFDGCLDDFLVDVFAFGRQHLAVEVELHLSF